MRQRDASEMTQEQHGQLEPTRHVVLLDFRDFH